MGVTVTADKYRRVDRSFTCEVCGASSLVTMIVGAGDEEPTVAVDHLAGGQHAPRIGGTSPAALARHNAPIGATRKVLRHD